MDKIKALIEGITQDLVADLVEEYNLSIEDALSAVYNSEVFAKLSDRETGLYRESSCYVADLLRNERSNGKLVQMEI